MKLLAELEVVTKSRFVLLRNELRTIETGNKKNYITVWKDFPYNGFYELEFRMLLILGSLTYERFTEKMHDFLVTSLSSIRELIISGEVAGKLHVARKEIKKIKYGLEWKDLSSGSIANFKFSHQEITLIEDKIGEWHDWLVFNRFLEEFYNRTINHDTRKSNRYKPLKVRAGKRLRESEKTSIQLIRRYFEPKS